MGKFTLIIGGTRSGKSRFAQNLAKNMGEKVVFIATCVPEDDEMKKRVAIHKKLRPREWMLIEEPKNVSSVLNGLNGKVDVALVDCMSLLVSNFLSEDRKGSSIKKKVELLAKIPMKAKFNTIIVSNEVGSGLVPVNPLGRQFADLLGLSNQILASYADNVYVMQSGIPMAVKGGIR